MTFITKTPHANEPSSSVNKFQLMHKDPSVIKNVRVSAFSGPAYGTYTNVFFNVCSFILIMEVCERFAYYMFQTNLAVFITTQLHKPQTSANMYSGLFSTLVFVTPLLGAYVADIKFGRYKTVIFFSMIYMIGLYMISFAALPFIQQGWLFFLGLFFFICLGAGGIKSNIATLGADQFDPTNPDDLRQLSSFFNWFYWMLNLGTLVACFAGNYALTGYGSLPKEYSYSLSFFIAASLFSLAVFVFVLGKYRYVRKPPVESALAKFLSIVLYAAKQVRQARLLISGFLLLCLGVLLDIILVVTETYWSKGFSRILFLYLTMGTFLIGTLILVFGGQSVSWIEVAKSKYKKTDVRAAWELLRMMPYLGFMIPFWLLHGVMHGIWTNQGCQMDTRLFGTSHVNPGSFSLCLALSMCVAIPICDFYLYPWIGRVFRKGESGPTPLQKIGVGYVFSMLTVVISAIIEVKRRNTPLLYGSDGYPLVSICDLNKTVDNPRYMSAISMWWQLIPYTLLGICEMLCSITAYDMFYSEVPKSMKSACQGLNLFADAIGAAFNVILQGVLKYHRFLRDDLNDGFQEVYYYTVGIILLVFFVFFLYVSESFEYKDNQKDVDLKEEIEGEDGLFCVTRLSMHERNTFARISGPTD